MVGVRTARGTTGGAVNVVERGGKRGRLTALPRRGSAWLEDASRGGIRGGDARFSDGEVFRRWWWRTAMTSGCGPVGGSGDVEEVERVKRTPQQARSRRV